MRLFAANPACGSESKPSHLCVTAPLGQKTTRGSTFAFFASWPAKFRFATNQTCAAVKLASAWRQFTTFQKAFT
jgi:anti-sigma factor RsiW